MHCMEQDNSKKKIELVWTPATSSRRHTSSTSSQQLHQTDNETSWETKNNVVRYILNDIKLIKIPYTNNLAIDIATLKTFCSDRQTWHAAVAALC